MTARVRKDRGDRFVPDNYGGSLENGCRFKGKSRDVRLPETYEFLREHSNHELVDNDGLT